MRRLWAILLLCATGVAEAASPVPADLYAEVDHALRPGVVLADPAAYRGRTLLLGGMVLRTVSDAGGVTIEVEGYRLDDDDRPESVDAAVGRVLAAGSGLDGAKLQPGRLVTLVGRVAGRSGNAGAQLPWLEILFVHPWPTAAEEEAARAPDCPPGYCCDPWGYAPWSDPWGCNPYPRWRYDFGYYRHWH